MIVLHSSQKLLLIISSPKIHSTTAGRPGRTDERITAGRPGLTDERITAGRPGLTDERITAA